MGAGRIVGGILAIIGASSILFTVIYYLINYGPDIFTDPLFLQMLMVSVLVLVGGILGVTGKRAGGGLALAGGCIWLIGLFLVLHTSFYYLMAISFLERLIPTMYVYFGIIEIGLAIAGGIVILASGE